MEMLIYTFKFDRKKLALAVVLAALLIVGVVMLIGAQQKAAALHALEEGPRAPAAVRNERSGADYLAALGWEVALPAESHSTVLIPRSFTSVFEEYNELQKRQGFDLSRYCGTELEMYSYRVTNAEYAGDEVLAVLYVKDGAVVGGDVHSTALDGFMVGIKQ